MSFSAPAKKEDPEFPSGLERQHGTLVLVTDEDGKLWVINMDSREANPVKFKE